MAECECYPKGFVPAEPWLRGCAGPEACKLRADRQQCASGEGRQAWMARYGTWSRERAASQSTAGDVSSRLAKAGVPGVTLSSALQPHDTEAMAAARRWVKADARLTPGMVLVGDKGTGKSVAAAWAALQWAQRFPWNEMPSGPMAEPFVWLDSGGMRKLADFGAEAARLVEQLASARFVVFDDTGREGAPRAIEAVSDALMERCDKSRRFVLTSNLRGAAFVERYGAPLADRLRVSAAITEVRGKSLRVAAEARRSA